MNVVKLQNNRILTYGGFFGFHRVAKTTESRLYMRAKHPCRLTRSKLRKATNNYVGWVLGGQTVYSP